MGISARYLRWATVAGLVGALLAAGHSAQAATDTSPPTWVKLPTTSIVLGGVLNTGPDGCDGTQMWSSVSVHIDYRATDPESAVAGYVAQAGDGFTVETAAERILYAAHEDSHSCGGGSKHLDFAAINTVSLMSEWIPWNSERLGVIDDRDSTYLTYSGNWSTSSCTCWSEGTVRRTSQAGAFVRATIPGNYVNERGKAITNKPYGLAVVMSKASDRGRAAIYVDGARVATVDTYSATPVNRTVVWRQAMTAGTHTVRIANLATAGRPRIDVDAVVMVTK